MNRFEFIACGNLLYGNSWKKELTRNLQLSERSRTVDKIALNERSVTEGISDDVLLLMKQKAKQLTQAIEFLENPEPPKILVRQADYSLVTFDERGVSVDHAFEETYISPIGVVIYHADIAESRFDYAVQSLIIAAAGQEALKKGNNSELLKVIETYFDLSFHNINLKEFKVGKGDAFNSPHETIRCHTKG